MCSVPITTVEYSDSTIVRVWQRLEELDKASFIINLVKLEWRSRNVKTVIHIPSILVGKTLSVFVTEVLESDVRQIGRHFKILNLVPLKWFSRTRFRRGDATRPRGASPN